MPPIRTATPPFEAPHATRDRANGSAHDPLPLPLSPTPASLARAFDADAFRDLATRIAERLADHLAATCGDARRADGRATPVLPWVPPAVQMQRWPAAFPERPGADPTAVLDALVARVLDESIRLHHPRYVGHQTAVALPAAAACEAVDGLLNNSTAIYEMAPAGVAMELAVLDWMAAQLGLGARAAGVFTSGGSLGTLTALLAARQARAGYDAWDAGAAGGPPLALLVSEQAHYCVDRAARIMGWGAEGVVRVPVDRRFRMRADALAPALRTAEARGRRVIAVVGSACSTPAGAFDPLPELADFCEAHDLWFHVDGAHGAAAALSPAYRHLVAGIERADSVVWDAHKLMMMPAPATAVLYRDRRHAAGAFAQAAPYLLDDASDEAAYNLAARTVETTRRAMATRLYVALASYGTGLFADGVTHVHDMARAFAGAIRAADDFQLACEPQSNIVCFRHVPAGCAAEASAVAGSATLDALQAAVRRRVVETGAYYLVQTRLPAGEAPPGLYLRVTLMNPLTTAADLAGLLDAVRAVARHDAH
jgi:L-2,4-diaminobutyrate decarboxylase